MVFTGETQLSDEQKMGPQFLNIFFLNAFKLGIINLQVIVLLLFLQV